MKLKIIETPDYILAVSDEEIKKNDLFEFDTLICKYDGTYKLITGRERKIIAYQPKDDAPELLPIVQYGNMTFKELNGDGSWYECIDCEVQTTRSGEFLKSQGVKLYKNKYELDLPLLPEMVIEDEALKFANEIKQDVSEYDNGRWYGRLEGFKAATKIYDKDDIEKLAKKHKEFLLNGGKDLSHSIQGMFSFMDGYKAATKVYSEEDLRKAMEYGMYKMKYHTEKAHNEFIQSLKQPKQPKWFVSEIELKEVNPNADRIQYLKCLKTTTISGKKYLVGTYLYE